MRPHAEPVAQRRSMARKVVVSDDEEEEYMESVHDPLPEPEEDDDDDYVSMDERPTPKSKGKGKATSGKGATATKGTKRKAKADPEDGLASTLEKKGSAKGSAAAKKRMKPTLRIDDNLIDVVGDSVPTPEASATVEMSSPATGKQDSPAPTAVPQPKKTKLPTIKKNKLPGTPNVGTPTSATSTSKKPLLELGLPSKINHDDVRKNMIGKTDIDLSNKSVYQELFLKTGSGDGNTPRRAKEEERRKELNRMREEAKAKRAAEAAQFDKIQLFEEKLKAIKSSAIYPNFLASKFRQVYDIDRMKQMSREANNQTPQNDKEPEEGEVS
ncbi:hypothetical protein CPC08DRAFT_240365 [Agrocybe pediades]|nr:hypothetical protein CPC08DRAFT_240365 [Agrocybe pediades]